MLNLILFLLAGHPLFSKLNAAHFEHYPILGIDSPTSLLNHNGDLYVSADLQGVRPGIYFLTRKDNVYQAALLKILPQWSIQSLNMSGDGLTALADYRFTVHPEDWIGQSITLDMETLTETKSSLLHPSALCRNGRLECGLTAAFPVGANHLLTISGNPAVLSTHVGSNGNYQRESQAALKIGNRAAAVSEVRLIDGQLIMLVKNLNHLAVLPMSDALKAGWGVVQLEPVFDFKPVTKTLFVKNSSVQFKGLAEGFAFDDSGALLILFNNRGETFYTQRPQPHTREPKLVVFPATKAAAIEK